MSRNKKIYLFIGVGLLAMFIIGFLVTKNNYKKENIELKGTEGLSESEPSFSYKHIVRFGLDAVFPQILYYKDKTIVDLINKDIESGFYGCFDGEPGQAKSDAEIRNELAEYYSDRLDASSEQIKTLPLEDLVNRLDFYSNVATSSDIFLRDSLFSFQIQYDSDCGGAHPSYGFSGYAYDLNSGKKLSQEDIFENFELDGVKDKIMKIFYTHYKNEFLKNEQGEQQDYIDDCITGAESSFEYSSFYINKNDLVVVPSFPHAMAACYIDVHVPIAELHPLFKNDSPLKRL